MPRPLKILLIVVALVTAALTAVVVAANHLVSRHDNQFIREQIEARTQAATGFKLQVRGPLELPYSLAPTVVLRDVVLKNPDYPGAINLLEADEFRVRFAVVPLLRGEVLIYESELIGVELNLEVDDAGRENWITQDEAGSTSALPAQIAVHTVNSSDLDISYVNRLTGASVHVELIDVSLRAPRRDEQIRIDILADYAGMPIEVSGQLGSSADILSGNVLPVDLEVDIFDVDIDIEGQLDRIEDGAFSDWQLRVDVSGRDLRELESLVGVTLPETSRFSGTAALDLFGESIVANDVSFRADWQQSEVEGSGAIGDVMQLGLVDVQVTATGSDVRQLSAFYELSGLPETDAYRLGGMLRGSWPQISLTDLRSSLTLESVSTSATGTVEDLLELKGLALEVKLEGADLADLDLTTRLSMPPTDSFRFAGGIQGDWPAVSLHIAEAAGVRGGLRLSGSGDIRDADGMTGIDVVVHATGEDLSGIPELDEFDLPATATFEVDASVTGDVGDLDFDLERAHASRGSHIIAVGGDLSSLPNAITLDLQVEMSGGNAADLNDIVTLNLPPTEHYALTTGIVGTPDNLAAVGASLTGEISGAEFEFSCNVGRVFDIEDLDLSIRARTENLDSLNRYAGGILPDTDAVEIAGRLHGTAPDLALDDFLLQSGESVINGSATVRIGERLMLEGSVTSGVVDLGPFLSGRAEEAAERARDRSGRLFTDAPLDLSFLDYIDARLNVDDLEVYSAGDRAHFEQSTLALQDGSLSVGPLRLTRDGAAIMGSLIIDRTAIPAYSVELALERVNISRVLADLDIDAQHEGKFDLLLELRSRGSNPREIASNLDGTVSAFVSEARIPEAGATLNALELLFELLPWVGKQDDINVNCAISHVNIEQGIAGVDLLYLDARQLTVIGGGSVDLGEEMLDLRLAPRPKKTRFLAHNIDMLVRGSFTSPRVTSTGATKAAATAYGKFALIGPLGLLVPTGRARTHACVGSLQEFRGLQAETELQ
jgi:uncharacterized protein involved in outer membrane biogenesis